MKLIKSAVFTCLSLIGISSALADVAIRVDARVLKGDYSITPARCAPETCKVETGHFAGSFTATLVADHIFFSNISIKSDSPNFTLPEDPYTAPAGAAASAKYNLQGNLLAIDGYINSSAFDGPIVEYHITAQSADTPVVQPPFNAQDYYLVSRDYRKCAAPMCGGYFVQSVNKNGTVCADKQKRAQCYVASADWRALGFDPFAVIPNASLNTRLLMRGLISPADGPVVRGKIALFTVFSAYRPASDAAAKGNFYGVENKGIVCITSPCFSFDEYLFNSKEERAISNFDLTAVKASEEDLATAYLLMGEGEVLPVVGVNKKEKQLAGIGIKLTASEFYLPLSAPLASCPEGYVQTAKGCTTKNNCPFPQWELTTHAGIIKVDPETGVQGPATSISCVTKCPEFAQITSPGYCEVFYQ